VCNPVSGVADVPALQYPPAPNVIMVSEVPLPKVISVVAPAVQVMIPFSVRVSAASPVVLTEIVSPATMVTVSPAIGAIPPFQLAPTDQSPPPVPLLLIAAI
jgi:hypothetical protein